MGLGYALLLGVSGRYVWRAEQQDYRDKNNLQSGHFVIFKKCPLDRPRFWTHYWADYGTRLVGVLFGFQIGADGGIVYGLSMGMVAFLWYGGLDVIQHYTLRLILWYRGHIPLNYIGFLNYAAERVFLQKVGGGYIFIHRLLLEHFAAMDEVKEDKN